MEYKSNEELYNKKLEAKEKLNNIIYYLIIFVLSMMMLFLLPFLGSSLDMGWNVPNTPAGWVVYCITNTCQSIANVLIFICFVRQGQVNSKNHPNYIKAQEIIMTKVKKAKRPISPDKFLGRTYASKGSLVAIGTVLGFIGLSNAILSWSIVYLIASISTVVMAIVFGIITMKKVELYWQYDYLDYANYLQSLQKEEGIKNERNLESVSRKQEIPCIESRTSNECSNEENQEGTNNI